MRAGPLTIALAGSLASHLLVAGVAVRSWRPTAEEPALEIAYLIQPEPEPAPAPAQTPSADPTAPPPPVPPSAGQRRGGSRGGPPAARAVAPVLAAATPAAPAGPAGDHPVSLPGGLTLRGLPAGGAAGDAGPAGRAPAGGPFAFGASAPRPETYRLRPDGRRGYVYSDVRFTAHIRPDGSVTFDDRTAGFDPRQLAVVFDVTDMIMRAHGEDPYAYEKRKFMEATWEQRMRMRVRADAETLRTALRDLPAHLEALWRDERRAPAARRRLLFLLWEECDERTAGGAEARAIIEGFVRRRLPAGATDAFTPGELATLNAGRAAPFAPYRE